MLEEDPQRDEEEKDEPLLFPPDACTSAAAEAASTNPAPATATVAQVQVLRRGRKESISRSWAVGLLLNLRLAPFSSLASLASPLAAAVCASAACACAGFQAEREAGEAAATVDAASLVVISLIPSVIPTRDERELVLLQPLSYPLRLV